MKKWISRLLTLCLAAVMALSLLPHRAEAAGASFSGASSLRSGETVTVTFSVSGSGIVAIEGTLSYDSGSLELWDTSCLLGGGWTMEMNGNRVVLYDSSLSSPVSSSSVFSATFRVKDGVSSGSTVSASVDSINVSDGSSDIGLGSAYWSATIAAPLSGNANLSGLSCGNATLSPAFSADVTSYSVTVPYDVTYLDLHYSVAHSGASAWVSGNDLSVGSNTVSVGVEAENGATKYYNIYVTRQQDPNYKASTNALLESLTPSSGRLSPGFQSDVKDYVVYVPYEVEDFSLSGVAQDGKALSVTEASAKLEPGDNKLEVTCTAEDGKTKVTYTVHVYRMPAYAGVLPTITDPKFADYSGVDAALAKVPADLSIYTDESVAALNAVIDRVKRDYGPDKQAEVDAMAKAIEDAVAALEKKPTPADLTPWQRVTAAAAEGLTIPYLSRLTGPLPAWALGLAAALLLALLTYIIGTLVGKHVGKKKALRAAAQVQAPAEELPTEAETPPETSTEDASAEQMTPTAAPAEDVPAEDPAPEAEETVPEKLPAEKPAEVPAEDAPTQDAPTEEAPPEEAPAEPAEEPSAEETPAALPDTPAEEDPLRTMSLDELLEDIKNM